MTTPLVAAVAAILSVVAGASGVLTPGDADAAFRAAVRGTAMVMAQRRGFHALRAPPVELVDDEGLERAAEAGARRSPGVRSDEQARLALHEALGLVSAATPAPRLGGRRAPGSAREPGVWLGLYQPSTGKVLISIAPDSRGDPLGLCHDLALALLDQRFHVRAFLDGRAGSASAPAAPSLARRRPGALGGLDADNLDAVLARQSVVEGDALVQALEQELPDGLPSPQGLAASLAAAETSPAVTLALPASGAETQVVAGAPVVSALDRARRLFPQTAGLLFMASLRARSPWKTLDALWTRPPESSEQVLHPEKYARHEHPDGVASRLPAGGFLGWQARVEDTLGELGVRVFLRHTADPYHAERAATGWGGDRALWLESRTGARAAVWITTWDDETDARDFAEQAAATLVALAESNDASVGRPGADFGLRLQLTDRRGRQFALETAPRTVGLLFAAPDGGTAALHLLVTAAATGKGKRDPRPPPLPR